METSTTSAKIQKFILFYGADTLIYWLDHFDKVISTKDYPLYRNLEKQACKACGVTFADMRKLKNTESCNARKIIAFISFNQLHIPVTSISNLLGVADRMINYYIRDAESWISNPKSNKGFAEAYNKVVENFKIK